ncbi:hypothetical protein DPMN_079720 [Dreissena polymorpha]|uniref:Uncharacterized protein n=1 Tax=Dreissena polymorpha TaxID=45954 RepID=A0A9D3YR98_DREPO|nr:hypothetical protein DPMN_079720 [Dreissena polymorpha]
MQNHINFCGVGFLNMEAGYHTKLIHYGQNTRGIRTRWGQYELTDDHSSVCVFHNQLKMTKQNK